MINFKQYLNPIVEQIDDIATRKNSSDDPLVIEEFPYLRETLSAMVTEVREMLGMMDRLSEQIEKLAQQMTTETGDDKSETAKDYSRSMKQMEQLIERINRTLETVDAPYFGKVIFDRKASEGFEARSITSYIGKFAYFDTKTNRMVVTDWRAPVANLYYEHSGPTTGVTFRSPAGQQSGDLKQKRQFEISEANIHSVYDAKSGNTSADQFLLTQLNNRIGRKLKEIVSTIQAQQNQIVREEIGHPAIIQGVAGSGKTTIILHRIAYLFFAYQQEIRPELTLIVAPNRMFLDYVSDVLPSLGIKGIQQNTYLFLAKSLMNFNEKYYLTPQKENLEIKRFKGSSNFIRLVEEYYKFFEEDIFEKMPGAISYDIRLKYYELKEKYPEMSMYELLNLSLDSSLAQKQFSRGILGNSMGELERLQESKKKISTYIRTRSNIYTLYKQIFKFYKPDPAHLSDFDLEWKEVCKHTLSYLVPKQGMHPYMIEDLAPMLWLYFKINGFKDHLYDYMVVDEAQDLSTFQLVTLLRIAKNGNLTIAGDVAQSIVPPFYIKDWEQLQSAFREFLPSIKEISYHQLFRCYRTTIEVIEYANRIFKKYFPKSYTLPEAVLRHGQPVTEITLQKPVTEAVPADIDKIRQIIKEENEANAATVAFICKDGEHATQVYNYLNTHLPDEGIRISSYADDNYQSGILVLPVDRAKGLEFDSVILLDVNAPKYSESEHDVRLFYVAVTRALHRLYIVTNNSQERSPLMKLD